MTRSRCLGLIPVFDPIGRANLGHARETAVLLELERRGAPLRLTSLTPEIPRDLPHAIAWHSASDWLLSERKELPTPVPKRRKRKRTHS